MTNKRYPISSTPDIGLLRKEVDWVKAQEKIPFESREREWYQGGWWRDSWYKAIGIVGKRLGTRYGRNSSTYDEQVRQEAESCGSYMCVAGHIAHQYDPDYHGGSQNDRHVDVAVVARDILGITHAEATELFAGTNDANRIEAIAQGIAERVGDRL